MAIDRLGNGMTPAQFTKWQAKNNKPAAYTIRDYVNAMGIDLYSAVQDPKQPASSARPLAVNSQNNYDYIYRFEEEQAALRKAAEVDAAWNEHTGETQMQREIEEFNNRNEKPEKIKKESRHGKNKKAGKNKANKVAVSKPQTPATTQALVHVEQPKVTREQFLNIVDKKYGNKYPGIEAPKQLPAGKGITISENVLEYVDRGDGVFVPKQLGDKNRPLLLTEGKGGGELVPVNPKVKKPYETPTAKITKIKGKGRGKAALIGLLAGAIGFGIGALIEHNRHKKLEEKLLNDNAATPIQNNQPAQEEQPAKEEQPVAEEPIQENQNAAPVSPELEEFAPGGVYTVVKGDCVWNIAKAKLTIELGRKPTNAEILRETYRIMEKNNEANEELGTRQLKWSDDHYHVMIKSGDKINIAA